MITRDSKLDLDFRHAFSNSAKKYSILEIHFSRSRALATGQGMIAVHKHTYRFPRFRTRVPFEPFRRADTHCEQHEYLNRLIYMLPLPLFHRIRCSMVSKTGRGRGCEQPRSAGGINAAFGPGDFLLFHDNCDISDPRIFQQIRPSGILQNERRGVEYAILGRMGGKKNVN